MEERDIGLLLPCNVVVYQGDHDGETVVSILDPVKLLEITEREDISELAEKVRMSLKRVMKIYEALSQNYGTSHQYCFGGLFLTAPPPGVYLVYGIHRKRQLPVNFRDTACG